TDRASSREPAPTAGRAGAAATARGNAAAGAFDRAGLMTDQSVAFLSAVELGRAFARRELSPVEVTHQLLERIDRLDRELRCWITVLPEQAPAAARAAEEAIGRGAIRGPLHGVPIGIKDLVDVAGVRCTAASRILAERVSARDAAVTERLAA